MKHNDRVHCHDFFLYYVSLCRAHSPVGRPISTYLLFLFHPHQQTTNQPQEDNFHNRPAIKLPVPDHLKALLVDDWENVTKNQQLVPLPHVHPVDEILNDYLAHEKPNRPAGSASLDILEETMAGLREYFDKSLGRILLYR